MPSNLQGQILSVMREETHSIYKHADFQCQTNMQVTSKGKPMQAYKKLQAMFLASILH